MITAVHALMYSKHAGAVREFLRDDLDATMAELAAKGVELTGEVHDQEWGRETAIRLPGGDLLGLYQPKHAAAYNLPR